MNVLKHQILLVFFMIIANLQAQNGINQFDANGKRQGVWSKIYSNGNIRYKGLFIHGKENGVFKYYPITGGNQSIATREYTDQTDIALVKFFSKKGILESTGKMKGKKRIGEWKYFFKDGKTILSIENYLDGLLDGEVKIFYKSEKLTEIAHYKKGKLNGRRIRYSDDGKETENLSFKDDVMHDPAILYNPDGTVFAKGNYENGIKSGTWEFNMDGEMVKSVPDKIRLKK
jgi:antitoxin component YwqK of YwqJK toxin-antitoxin module